MNADFKKMLWDAANKLRNEAGTIACRENNQWLDNSDDFDR